MLGRTDGDYGVVVVDSLHAGSRHCLGILAEGYVLLRPSQSSRQSGNGRHGCAAATAEALHTALPQKPLNWRIYQLPAYNFSACRASAPKP